MTSDPASTGIYRFDGRCKHEMLPPCGECEGPARGTVAGSANLMGPWFPARFEGRCSGGCGRRIHEGDTIRADGEGGWLCHDCG